MYVAYTGVVVFVVFTAVYRIDLHECSLAGFSRSGRAGVGVGGRFGGPMQTGSNSIPVANMRSWSGCVVGRVGCFFLCIGVFCPLMVHKVRDLPSMGF